MLFHVDCSLWRLCAYSQMRTGRCFLSVFLYEDPKQTAKWRVTAASCQLFSAKTVHSQTENSRCFLSVFSNTTVHRQSNRENPQFPVCFFSTKTVHRQSNRETSQFPVCFP
jgi:hypothetical protein